MKKILDVTCGSRSIWFNKNHPSAIYCDKRKENLTGIWSSTSGSGEYERSCVVDPDIQCDFTDLPFDDDTFSLVVLDPPHLRQAGETGCAKSTVYWTITGHKCFMMVLQNV